MQQLRALFQMVTTLAVVSALAACPAFGADKLTGPPEKIAAWRFLQTMSEAQGWTAEFTTTLAVPGGEPVETHTTGTWTNAASDKEAYARMTVTAEVLGADTVTDIWNTPTNTTFKITSALGSGSSIVVLPSQAKNRWAWLDDRTALAATILREAFEEAPRDPYFIYAVTLPKDGFEQHEALTDKQADRRLKDLKAEFDKLQANYDAAYKKYQADKKAWDAKPKAAKEGKRGPLPPRNKPTRPQVKQKDKTSFKHFEVAEAAARSVGRAIPVQAEKPSLAVLLDRYVVAESYTLSSAKSPIKGCTGVLMTCNSPRKRLPAGGIVYHIDSGGALKGLDTLDDAGKPVVTIRFKSMQLLDKEIPKRIFQLDDENKKLDRDSLQDVEKWADAP